MALQRQAILVACDPEQELTGITKDIEGWNAFLHSPYGGAWRDSEISILDSPNATVENLKSKVKYANYESDYLFVYFSGHGGMPSIPTQSDGTSIQLTDGFYSENDLRDVSCRCQRKTIFLDCCRTPWDIPHGTHRVAARITDFEKAESLFMWLVSISAPGVVNIYAASRNETAKDPCSFTQYFLREIGQVIETHKNFICYDTYTIFRNAKRHFPENELEQHPQYISDDKNIYPLVVNPYVTLPTVNRRSFWPEIRRLFGSDD